MDKPRIDYTSRDWASIGASLETYIRSRFPQWTDFQVANVGNVFKEMIQYIADGLHHQLDFYANELFHDTAILRESLLAQAELLDYHPEPRRASLVRCKFFLEDGPRAADVVIPRRTLVWTAVGQPLPFEVQETVVIRAGTREAYGLLKQARTWTETFEVRAMQWREIRLSRTPFLMPGDSPNHGRIRVRVDGVEWQRLESIVDAKMGQPAYEVRVDGDGRGWIMFGDGNIGAVVSGLVEVTYETGGGSAGNVGVGALGRLGSVVSDANGVIVSVSVVNEEPAVGGADEEDIERMRWRIPKARRSGDRSVHNEDFEANALSVPGVIRAKAATAREDPSIEEATQRVYIVPEGGGEPSPLLLSQVEALFRDVKPALSTIELDIRGARYHDFDVVAQIRVHPGYDELKVAADVEAAIRKYLDFESVDPFTGRYIVDWGRTIHLSEIIWSIHEVEGVRGAFLVAPGVTSDVVPGEWEIPRLRSVSVQVV